VPGGRPSQGRGERHAWLAELAGWFKDELAKTELSRLAFAERLGLSYQELSTFANAERLPTRETVQLVAFAFRQEWAQVEPIWDRATQGAREAERRRLDAAIPPLTSWDRLPTLAPELKDLLDAQCVAYNSLPYQQLGVKAPPLSEVYVRQTLRQRTPAARDEPPRAGADPSRKDGPPPAEQPDRPIPVSDAFAQHQHLLITGPPGAGKSTLASMFVYQLSQCWLHGGEAPIAEPVLPIRIPARALAGEGSWTELVAAGVSQALRNGLPTVPPRPEWFAGRMCGARWMIFIDGIDEIIDSSTRQRVLQAIARQPRRGGAARLVITSRELPRAQLELLESAELGTFTIRPFGVDDLAEFARSWFRAQDRFNWQPRAQEFLRQVRDERLSNVVTNPLLATIAATVLTREPAHPLPSNRIGLYRKFVSYLMDGRDPLAQLTSAGSARTQLARLLTEVHERRHDIVGALATARLETSDELGEAARAWVVRELGEPSFEDWDDAVIELLLGLGVFVREGDGIGFLHYSFAEFLAAQRYPEVLPSELDDWIRRALDEPAKEQFILFLFAQWSSQPAGDPSWILRRLLAGGWEWLALAGKLVAEVGELDRALTRTLADRLINILVAADPTETDGCEEVCRALGGWADQETDDYLVDRLGELLARTDLSAETRLLCALAFGYARGGAEAERYFTALTPEITPWAFTALVSTWSELVTDGARHAERALLACAHAGRRPAGFYVLGAEALFDQGMVDSARALLAMLMERAAMDGPDDAIEFFTLACYDRPSLAELPEKLELPGAVALVQPRAEKIGRHTHLTTVRAAMVAAPDQLDEIVARFSDGSVERSAELAVLLQELGHREAAVRLGRRALDEGWRTDAAWLVADVVSTVFADDPAYEEEMSELAIGWPIIPPHHAALLGKMLQEAGHRARATVLAVHALETRDADAIDVRHAVTTLLKLGFDVDRLLNLTERLPIDALRGAFQALCNEKRIGAAERLFARNMDELAHDSITALHVIRIIRKAGGRLASAEFVERLGLVSPTTFIRLVYHYRIRLELNDSPPPAPAFGPWLSDGDLHQKSLGELVNCWYLHRPDASAEITQMLADYPAAPGALLAIGDTMAARGLLDDACSTWLRVYGKEDVELELLLTVTNRLRRCGRSGDARKRLREVSGRPAMSAPTQRNLAHLAAWLDAVLSVTYQS
jgi:transcriptional regulator with XRE-family HTH domain